MGFCPASIPLAGFETSLIGRFSGVPRGYNTSQVRFFVLGGCVALATSNPQCRDHAKGLSELPLMLEKETALFQQKCPSWYGTKPSGAAGD